MVAKKRARSTKKKSRKAKKAKTTVERPVRLFWDKNRKQYYHKFNSKRQYIQNEDKMGYADLLKYVIQNLVRRQPRTSEQRRVAKEKKNKIKESDFAHEDGTPEAKRQTKKLRTSASSDRESIDRILQLNAVKSVFNQERQSRPYSLNFAQDTNPQPQPQAQPQPQPQQPVLAILDGKADAKAKKPRVLKKPKVDIQEIKADNKKPDKKADKKADKKGERKNVLDIPDFAEVVKYLKAVAKDKSNPKSSENAKEILSQFDLGKRKTLYEEESKKLFGEVEELKKKHEETKEEAEKAKKELVEKQKMNKELTQRTKNYQRQAERDAELRQDEKLDARNQVIASLASRGFLRKGTKPAGKFLKALGYNVISSDVASLTDQLMNEDHKSFKVIQRLIDNLTSKVDLKNAKPSALEEIDSYFGSSKYDDDRQEMIDEVPDPELKEQKRSKDEEPPKKITVYKMVKSQKGDYYARDEDGRLIPGGQKENPEWVEWSKAYNKKDEPKPKEPEKENPKSPPKTPKIDKKEQQLLDEVDDWARQYKESGRLKMLNNLALSKTEKVEQWGLTKDHRNALTKLLIRTGDANDRVKAMYKKFEEKKKDSPRKESSPKKQPQPEPTDEEFAQEAIAANQRTIEADLARQARLEEARAAEAARQEDEIADAIDARLQKELDDDIKAALEEPDEEADEEGIYEDQEGSGRKRPFSNISPNSYKLREDSDKPYIAPVMSSGFRFPMDLFRLSTKVRHHHGGKGRMCACLKERIQNGRGDPEHEQEGLSSEEIENIMADYEEFGGVFAIDEVDKAPFSLDENVGIVVNLDPHDLPGSHWVALYMNNDEKSFEYYDSYAEDPPIELMEQIQNIMQELHPEEYYKFRINRVIQQRSNSDTCGWFAMRWLISRFEGVPYKECTGWSEVMESEKDIKKFKEKFGYV